MDWTIRCTKPQYTVKYKVLTKSHIIPQSLGAPLYDITYRREINT